MANDLTVNPLKIDTADAGALLTQSLLVRKIRWVGATTAGHQAVVSDQFGNVFWESVAPGDNYVEESDFTTYTGRRQVLNGLEIATLGSGTIYIYQ